MRFLDFILRRNGDKRLLPLSELSRETGVQYVTLKKAAQQKRLTAVKLGHFWFASPKDVERAQAEGKIRKGG